MMGTTARTGARDPDHYLSPGEKDLLVAALVSNSPRRETGPSKTLNRPAPSSATSATQLERPQPPPVKTEDARPKDAPETKPSAAASSLDNFGFDDPSLADYGLDLEFDDSFNFDMSTEFGEGQLDGTADADDGEDAEDGPSAIPAAEHDGDIHDKRKNPGDDDDAADVDGSAKRRESGGKLLKKPGRKPLTSEPTTKRKAQNRAAQRAFRERKEKHLRDLETKVEDLEKASESANHENGLLRAQVTRLQEEIREYRRRMSTSSMQGSYLPSDYSSSFGRKSSDANTFGGFDFDFAEFGGPQASRPYVAGALGGSGRASGAASRMAASVAPSASQTPPRQPASESATPESGLRPTIKREPSSSSSATAIAAATRPGGTGPTAGVASTIGMSTIGSFPHAGASSAADYFQPATVSRDAGVERNRSGRGSIARGPINLSLSASASPSASSVSHHAAGSSACTSPSSYLNSPANAKGMDAPATTMHGESSMQPSQDATTQAAYQTLESLVPASNHPIGLVNGIDWLAQQNGGQFDPVLFGDYREPQEAITSGDYGYFSDSFPRYGFSGPLNEAYPPSQAPTKITTHHQHVAEHPPTEAKRAMTAEKQSKVEVNCDMLWNHIQNNHQFRSGELDIDGLCADLQKKAVCSETGIAIDQPLVDALLAKFSNTEQARLLK